MIYYKPVVYRPIKDIKEDDINLNAVTISAVSSYFDVNNTPRHNRIIIYLYLNCGSGNEFYYTSDDNEATAIYIDTNALDSVYLTIEGYTVAIFKAECYFKKLADNTGLPIFATVRAKPDNPENTIDKKYALISILVIVSILMIAVALETKYNPPISLVPVSILAGFCIAKIIDKLS